jgi:hypothetical protein
MEVTPLFGPEENGWEHMEGECPAQEPRSETDRDYADRLAEFIIDHIGRPYTAEECGLVLEIRPKPDEARAGSYVDYLRSRAR